MKELFYLFQSYLDDPDITDVNYNGRMLWLDHLKKGRYRDDTFCDDEIEQFCFQVANRLNLPFNVTNPLLEAETEDMRISILHPSVSKSGISISIRKTPAVQRLSRSMLIKEKYAPAALLDFLKLAVQKGCNIMVGGLPGVGKTELIKFLASYIPSHQRIITIEDTLELRHHIIHPASDCVALKVNERFKYSDAIKASLRQKPDWLLVSEIRSHEVVYLLEAVSTGAHLLSTIHCSQAASIPKRMIQMFPDGYAQLEAKLEMMYEAVDIGVYLQASVTDNGIRRQIAEAVVFTNEARLCSTIIYDGQKLSLEELPKPLYKKLYPMKERRKKTCS